MGTLGSLAVGAALGLLLMAALAASAHVQSARRPARAAGLERLARGAAAWQVLASPDGQPVTRMWQGVNGRLLVGTDQTPYGSWWDGVRWKYTTELPPPSRTHPTIPDTFWHALPDGSWLSASAGSCAPQLAPSTALLPALPRVEAELFHHRLRAATRTSDGHLLVVVQHVDGAVHAWRLAPGAATWTDTGALPAPAASARLVPGFAGEALVLLGGGAMALHDGERWRALPRPKQARLGWEAGLAEDGAVLAGGGFPDTTRREAWVRLAIGLALLGLAALAVHTLQVGVIALIVGGCFGVVGAVALILLLWVFGLGARI